MKNSIFSRLMAALLALSLLLPALPSPAAAEEAPAALSVTLSQTSLELTLGGEAKDLTAALGTLPAGAAVAWEWKSDPEGNAAVTPSGAQDSATATAAVAPGPTAGADVATVTATATVTVSGAEPQVLTAECSITVSYAAATGITLNYTTISMKRGDEPVRVTAEPTPDTADKSDVSWGVNNASVIALDRTEGESVWVSATGPGEATITATAGSGAVAATCGVTVTGLVLDQTSLTLTSGKTAQLTATGYGDGVRANKWVSSNEGVATVSSGGLITAREAGQAVITASYNEDYPVTCTVTVNENTAGIITQSITAGEALTFSSLTGEINSRCQELLDTSLSYVTGLAVSSTDQGILYYNYVSADNTGAGVSSQEKYYYNPSSGRLDLANVTFVAKSDFSGTATIRYTGYNASNQFFTGTIRVTVAETQDVVYSTGVNTPLTFSASDFSTACRAKNGRDAHYVSFTLPSSRYGTLYYNYVGSGQLSTPVEQGTPYYVNNNPYLSRVTFVPAENYTGTVHIPYTGVDTAGYTFRGRVTIYVSGSTGGSGDVNYTAYAGRAVDFDVDDFNDLSRDVTGRNLSYVRFTLPASGDGTLYYNYTSSSSSGTKVSASTRYYRNSTPYLSRITFVPASGASGTVKIPFTGYDVDGYRFDGTVEIRIGDRGGTGYVSYQGRAGREVEFSATDFNSACREVLGENLSYVRFTLPASSRGTLYYNYTSSSSGSKVSASTRYYRSGSPSLSQVGFVPQSGYSGTVEIDFTGWDVSGYSFDGTVEIEVERGSGAGTRLSYSILAGDALTFDPADFNDVCRDETGYTLSYVRFTLPTSSTGSLYYNYNEDTGKYDSKASASTSYYRSSGSRLLSRLSFVPAEDYTGTVELEYTGWSTQGDKYTGTVRVTVTAPVAGAVRYNTGSAPVVFRMEDFNTACYNLMGRNMSWVRFTPPSSSAGRLYFDYTGPGQYASEVRSSTNYYRSTTPSLDRVSFVPKASFQGTASISYTGQDTSGSTYSGTVEVSVSYGTSAVFQDMGSHSWAVGAVDFLYQNGVVGGIGANQYGPGRTISRADFVLMLCKAFDLKAGSGSGFDDVPTDSYYAQAATTAKALGITQGSGGNRFQPLSAITRQDAMVMLQKAMQTAGWSISSGSASLLNRYQDGNSVAGYAQGAVAAMVQLGVISGDTSGRLNPGGNLTRAEMAVVLHQALTL